MTNETNTDPEHQDTTQTYPTLSIDWDLYGELLEDSDLSDEEKREFLTSIWNIVVSFVDLGFGISSSQQACEQQGDLSSAIERHVINSDQDLSNSTEDQNILSDSAANNQMDSRKETP